MKITLLGTGTSIGVPTIGCDCKVCTSTDPRDKHLRCAALVQTEHTQMLIDCGPDIRHQMLPRPFRKLDGVLLTHEHYDHVGGIDDLRPFCIHGTVNLYGKRRTLQHLRRTMYYCFPNSVLQRLAEAFPLFRRFGLYPGVPLLKLNEVKAHQSFAVGDIEVMPINVMHGRLPIFGYRMGKFAYITDMKTIPDAELHYLRGVEVLVVNALRFDTPHHSHQLVADAVAFAQRVGARAAYLIHCNHDIGRYEEVARKLPEGVFFGYDGLQIEV